MGTTSTCILYTDLGSCVFLVTHTRGDTSHVEPEMMNEGGGFNSAISPRCVRPANNSQFDFSLGLTAKRRLSVHTLGKLHQVLRFFCLDLGCQQVQGEIYLSTGLLDPVPATGGCTTCPICTQCFHKDFLPVFWSSVIEFIGRLTATSKPPFKIEIKIQVLSFFDGKHILERDDFQ